MIIYPNCVIRKKYTTIINIEQPFFKWTFKVFTVPDRTNRTRRVVSNPTNKTTITKFIPKFDRSSFSIKIKIKKKRTNEVWFMYLSILPSLK